MSIPKNNENRVMRTIDYTFFKRGKAIDVPGWESRSETLEIDHRQGSFDQKGSRMNLGLNQIRNRIQIHLVSDAFVLGFVL